MSMRWNPLRMLTFTAPVAVGAASGAIAGAEGLSPGAAAAVAGATVAAGAAATVGSRIMRRPSREERGQASQIRAGLLKLLERLTQSRAGRRLPATAIVLVQREDTVTRWTDQLKDESQVAGDWADDRLARALSNLRLAIQQQRAYCGQRQEEFLEIASQSAASESDTALLLALLSLELTKKEAELLLEVAPNDGFTLQEAVWLLLLMREFPEASRSLEKLLLEIRDSSDEDRDERVRVHVQASSIEAVIELLVKGITIVEEVFEVDELEQRIHEALWVCDSVIG